MDPDGGIRAYVGNETGSRNKFVCKSTLLRLGSFYRMAKRRGCPMLNCKVGSFKFKFNIVSSRLTIRATVKFTSGRCDAKKLMVPQGENANTAYFFEDIFRLRE